MPETAFITQGTLFLWSLHSNTYHQNALEHATTLQNALEHAATSRNTLEIATTSQNVPKNIQQVPLETNLPGRQRLSLHTPSLCWKAFGTYYHRSLLIQLFLHLLVTDITTTTDHTWTAGNVVCPDRPTHTQQLVRIACVSPTKGSTPFFGLLAAVKGKYAHAVTHAYLCLWLFACCW